MVLQKLRIKIKENEDSESVKRFFFITDFIMLDFLDPMYTGMRSHSTPNINMSFVANVIVWGSACMD